MNVFKSYKIANIQYKSSLRWVITFILIVFVIISNYNTVLAGTGINAQIPYSGTIVKNDGALLGDGSYRAKFLIYNVSSGGTAIYEEVRDGSTTYSGVVSPLLSVVDGRFEILLGSQNTALSSINDDSLWVELQLDADGNGSYEEIFSPRKRIGSAMSAINSMRLVANGGTSNNTLSLDSTGNLIFTGDSATERMRISGTGAITASALGGVANTTTPSGFDRVLLANSSGQFSQLSLGNFWSLLGNNTTTAWNGTTGSFLGTTSAQPLVLATTNATAQDIRFFTGANGANERMRISGDGNVVIGTTDFSTTNGNIGRILKLGSANNNLIISETSTTNRYLILESRRTSRTGGARNAQLSLGGDASDNGEILFFTATSGADVTERMRILSTGSVGIGTTTPGSALQINGGVAIGYSANTTAPTNGLAVSGNAGLGTTSPGAQLTVNLPTQATNTVNSLLITRFQRPQTGSVKWGNSMDILLGSYGTSINSQTRVDFRLANGGTDLPDTTVMTLQGNGNVGIGTTSPSFTLDVNGNIRAERYRGINSLVLNTYTTVNPSSNVFLYSQTNDRDSWIYLDSADTGSNWGIYHRQIDSTVSNLPANSIGFIGGGSNTLQSYISLKNGNAYFAGNVGIGTTSPTAKLNLAAGTATANTAPLKFTSGTNLTTPEAGALEWNGTNLFLTTSGSVRQTINQGLAATATLDFPSTNNAAFSNLTVTVTGAVDGDVVTLGLPNTGVPAANSSFTAWVSSANTVTVRFNNNSGSAQDPASASFKIFVTKF